MATSEVARNGKTEDFFRMASDSAAALMVSGLRMWTITDLCASVRPSMPQSDSTAMSMRAILRSVRELRALTDSTSAMSLSLAAVSASALVGLLSCVSSSEMGMDAAAAKSVASDLFTDRIGSIDCCVKLPN